MQIAIVLEPRLARFHAVTKLLLAHLFLCARSAPLPPAAPSMRSAYEQSRLECPNKAQFGHRVVIATAVPAEQYAQSLREKLQPSDSINGVCHLTDVVAATLSSETLEVVFDDRTVSSVEVDCPLELFTSQTIEGSSDNWGLDRVDQREAAQLPGAFHYNASGAGVTVYVIDTGVLGAHHDFSGRVLSGYSTGCPTAASCSPTWRLEGVYPEGDACGAGAAAHGTHCASVAAGLRFGIAKGANVVSVQVVDCDGKGSTSTAIQGLDWVVADARSKGVPAVVTMSLGVPWRSGTLDLAAQRAVEAGITLVRGAAARPHCMAPTLAAGAYSPPPF